MRNIGKHIEKIIPNLQEGERFVLGIDGLSRAGKTTITEQLEELLKEKGISYVILHIDDFIETRENRYQTGREQWEEYYYLQWNVMRLKRDLFDICKSANSLDLLFYEEEKDQQFRKQVLLPSTCVVVIEGVFLQREIWRDSFDFVVYIEATKESRFTREESTTKRQIDKFQKRYWKAEEYYIETVDPKHKANLVIQN